MAESTGMNYRFTAAAMACVFCMAWSAAAQPMPSAGSGTRETIATPTPTLTVDATANGYGHSYASDAGGQMGYGSAERDFELWDGTPPVTESTGTWHNRGMWYAQVEAVVMFREWDRSNLVLAGDGIELQSPVTGNPTGDFSNSDRKLVLGRSSPGREGSARFTLGKFLFRDCGNRDHNMEFTILGGGEFGHNCSIFANNPADPRDLVDNPASNQSLSVPQAVDLSAAVSFDGAESMFVQYDSRFNSFEMNYSMSTRLMRDRMELMPSGQWLRRANAGLTYQFIGGLRYFDLTENIEWNANNISNNGIPTPLAGETGQYLVRSSNDLFGLQSGAGATYEGARFSISLLGKMGIFANDAKTRSGLTFTANDGATRDDLNFSNSNRGDTLSFLGEFSIVGRYFLKPNVSLRAGYHAMYISELALAPHQLNFAPDDAKVVTSGDSFYGGISSGLDFYW